MDRQLDITFALGMNFMYFIHRKHKNKFCGLEMYKIYSNAQHTFLNYAYSGNFQKGKKLPLDWTCRLYCTNTN
jgi:hypothetical protein